MAAIMRAPVARASPVVAASKASKVGAVAPKAAFMGNAKALKATCVAVKSRAQRMTTVMKASDVSASYASALLEMAQATGALEAIHADMDALETVCNDELMGFLSNPVMTDAQKAEVVSQICKEGDFSAATTNFLNLLVDKKRVSFLSEIVAEFDDLYCEVTDTQVATVTSAVKLENEQQFLIAKKLQEMTGAKNIKLKPQVDESLIGGFIVTYGPDGSSLIDMSVKGQLDLISASLLPASA